MTGDHSSAPDLFRNREHSPVSREEVRAIAVEAYHAERQREHWSRLACTILGMIIGAIMFGDHRHGTSPADTPQPAPPVGPAFAAMDASVPLSAGVVEATPPAKIYEEAMLPPTFIGRSPCTFKSCCQCLRHPAMIPVFPSIQLQFAPENCW